MSSVYCLLNLRLTKNSKLKTKNFFRLLITVHCLLITVISCQRSKNPIDNQPPPPISEVKPPLRLNWPSAGTRANVLVGDALVVPDKIVYWFWIGLSVQSTVSKMDSLTNELNFTWIGGEIIYNDTLTNGFYFNPYTIIVSGDPVQGGLQLSSIGQIRNREDPEHSVRLVPAVFDSIIYFP